MSRRRHAVPSEFYKASAPVIRSARDLMTRDLPAVRWVIPKVLPEGVTLLAGKAKIRKSWFAMGLCNAVAAGGFAFGKISVERGEALYAALEDNERRLQSRLGKILGSRRDEAPEGFYYATSFPRLGQGGEEALKEWLEEHPECRLVILDTLAKVRPRTKGSHSGYQEDYEALESLLPIASEYQVAIVVVTHTRKATAADILDEVNATTGLMGGVDGFLIFKTERGKNEATMYVDGREIEEPGELSLRWDRELHGWMLVGEAEETRLTEQRRAILDALREAGEPMGPKAIADVTKLSHGSVRNLLGKLAGDLRVESAGRGKWRLAENLPLPSQGEHAAATENGNVHWHVGLSSGDSGDDRRGDSENPHRNTEKPSCVTGVTEEEGNGVSGVCGEGDDSGDRPEESDLGKSDPAATTPVTDGQRGDSLGGAEIPGKCKHDVQGGCWLCQKKAIDCEKEES